MHGLAHSRTSARHAPPARRLDAAGAADEQKPAPAGSIEAWGRFGMYLPPLLEELGLVELEHNARNNRVRAR